MTREESLAFLNQCMIEIESADESDIVRMKQINAEYSDDNAEY